MEPLKGTEQMISAIKDAIIRSSADDNVDLNALSNAVRAYVDLANFFMEKIQADKSIFKSIEEEVNYMRIPLSSIIDCRGRNAQSVLDDMDSMFDKANYIKHNQEFFQSFCLRFDC